MSRTRADNLLTLVLFPLRLAAFVVSMALMVAPMPLLLAGIVVLLLPAELAWFASIFVGIVSPRAGAWLASFMEPACDRLCGLIDLVWAPAGWIADKALG